jgi:hypothetical protein
MKGLLLSLSSLLVYLEEAIEEISDPRKASNGTKYDLRDAVLAAFSMFFMQSESFLEHQRQMESHHGKSNAQTLFGVFEIPSVPQIRNILDGIAASSFFGLFRVIFHTVLQLVDASYQKIRQTRGTRKGFFQDVLALTKYFLFQSWQHLIDFMLYASPAPINTNSS